MSDCHLEYIYVKTHSLVKINWEKKINLKKKEKQNSIK